MSYKNYRIDRECCADAIQKFREMQRSRTKELLLFIFGAHLIFAAPSVVTSYKLDGNANGYSQTSHNKRNVLQLIDITERNDDNNLLITYQPINQAAPNVTSIGDSGAKLIEITVDGFDVGSDSGLTHLISTPSNDSCRENALLPAWKIDSNEGKFRLRINHAEQLAGRVLFLCVYDESEQKFVHLGDSSRFTIDR